MLSGVDERIEEVPHHVSLAPNNGLMSDVAACRFRATNRLVHRSKQPYCSIT
jgi:hypothetical protein